MPRETYVMRNGQLVLKRDAAPLNAGAFVISDYLPESLEHHGYSDGRRTDSKATFRRWTREAGLIEKGNDRAPTARQQGDGNTQIIRDVAHATEMVKNGYRPVIRQHEE